MAYPPRPVRPTLLHLSLPEDVRVKLDLFLYSEAEQRVPKGAYQAFFIQRIQEFFGNRRLDLAPFGFPPGYSVTAPPEMLEALRLYLTSNQEGA